MRDFRNILIWAVILFCYSFNAHGQVNDIDKLSASQLKRFGIKAEHAGDIHTAIFLFEKYRKKRGDNIEINYKLAELHRKARNYSDALKYYLTVKASKSKKYPMAQFYYAQMLKATGDYEKANAQLNEFRKNYNETKDSRLLGKIVKDEIEGCDTAKIMMKTPQSITISSLNHTINSPHIELSPLPLDDNTFLYSSLRVDSFVFFSDDNIDTAMPVRQFYMAKKEGMDWTGGKPFSKEINIPGVETGNGIISRDGKRFYFTRCQKNWQGKVICAIYRSFYYKGEWSKPQKLPPIINDPNYTSTMPALARTQKTDREIIYFVSDRPLGKGGMDIWYTVWDEDKDLYSSPRNAGSKINTYGDELSPFYNYPNRTFFFSSTGMPGMGGFDINQAFGERNQWEKVGNIGYPFNSSYDDLYFTISNKAEDGFLVSNRPNSTNHQTCCDDIFYYRWNDFIRITATGTIYPFEKDRFGRKRDYSKFDFHNPDKSIKPLVGAKVALWVKDKKLKEYIFLDRYTTGNDGKFYFTLSPDFDYEFKMEGFQYFDSKNYLSTEFFYSSDTISLPPTWVNIMSDKPIVLKNIYYEFNEYELSRQAKNVLDTTLLIMLKEAPEFVIEIGSHTDSIGENKYNLELSQKRADNVVAYMVSKGISSKRLVAKGYGSLHPVAPNFNADGSDNEVGRNMNRRTEFRITGNVGDIEEDEQY